MRYSENADLDTSAVTDTRGGGGGFGGGRGLAVGGGGLGLVGLVVVVLLNELGGGGGCSSDVGSVLNGFGGVGQGQSADNSQLEQDCTNGSDAHTDVQCAVVADINSV